MRPTHHGAEAEIARKAGLQPIDEENDLECQCVPCSILPRQGEPPAKQ
jgi:hypothetical protein